MRLFGFKHIHQRLAGSPRCGVEGEGGERGDLNARGCMFFIIWGVCLVLGAVRRKWLLLLLYTSIHSEPDRNFAIVEHSTNMWQEDGD